MGERTAEEWGKVAVGLPGWRWMPGMLSPCRGVGRVDSGDLSDDPLFAVDFSDAWPDPDDPATAGCLLALLGDDAGAVWWDSEITSTGAWCMNPTGDDGDGFDVLDSLGRACIAAAEAMGRWPGGQHG